MSKFSNSLWALVVAGFSSVSLADTAETKGGLTVRSDDGRFELKFGGRLQLDAYAFEGCSVNGADCASGTTLGGMFLRRGYLSTSGQLYGWKYKHEFDLASSASAQSSWREAWVATALLGGELTVGQFKPYRGMEELTSSNEILMLERPYASASSLYGGSARQFQMGVGYKRPLDIRIPALWAISIYNLHAIGQSANDGLGVTTRFTLLPVASDQLTVHLGLVYGQDDFNRVAGSVAPQSGGPAAATIAGRNGGNQVTSPTVSLGATSPGESQSTFSLEAAASFGPGFVQAEYASSSLGQASTSALGVTSYYVQGSYFITGETKPYRKDRATFGSPKPNYHSGAWEVTGRFEVIENGDLTGPSGKPKVTQLTTGANYYINPNLRLMLNFSMGEAQTTNTANGAIAKTEVNAIALRTQLSF